MPRIIMYRRNATPLNNHITVSTIRGEEFSPVLHAGVRRSVNKRTNLRNLPELLENLRDLKDRGVIGYQVDNGDIDAEDVKILSGFKVGNGSSANTTANYYMSCEAGQIKVGSHIWYYEGTANSNPLVRCRGLDGTVATTRLLDDTYARYTRWYAIRLYHNASDSEAVTVYGVMGDDALLADVALPTDAQAHKVLSDWSDSLAGTYTFIDWIEVGRQLTSRSTTTINNTYTHMSESDPVEPGVSFIDVEVKLADFGAATTFVKTFNPISGILVGATLQTLEPIDLASTTVQLGRVGSTDDIFAALQIGTGGPNNGVGLMPTVRRGSTPFLAGDVLVNYTPSVLFTGGANLNTATAGHWRIRLYYIPAADTTVAKVQEGFFEEHTS